MVVGVIATQSVLAQNRCDTPLSPNIANSCIVNRNKLWRGERPSAAGATALLDLGVKTIINLELLLEDEKAFESASPNLQQTHRVDYFKVPDWEPLVVFAPGIVDKHVAHFLAITRMQKQPMYVHCRSGQNRTGVMVAAYNVFNGMSIEDAVSDMGRYQGIWFKQDAAYIRGLSAKRRAKIEMQINRWIPKLKRDAVLACALGKCEMLHE
jgi:protein tyrosine/serine phosphatase